jgi:glycerol-3-phosphate acyltransferase PlsY
MLWQSALLIASGYLLGSIPTSYLAGRLVRNIDLRQYGSGTVSGSMVYEHVGRWIVVPVGLFDIAKGAFPAWLGLQLGLGEFASVAAGTAAVIGHNWPVYLRFTGGRGLSPYMGMMLVIFPWGTAWLLGFLAVGFLLGDSAPWALSSLLTTPLLVYFMGGPVTVYLAVIAMLIVTLAKRLEANRRPLPPAGKDRRRVILLRALFDRDIRDHQEWIRREPDA